MNDVERDGVKRAFNDPNSSARVLLATDAAGEGLNLQRACRLMLHWDIPWNPGKMEQRNGRLDRHGQERDVHVFHFDSTDDASMRFLGKVLKKRSQTREDQVVTDELFSQALLKHFEEDEDVNVAEERLEATIRNLKAKQKQQDVPDGPSLPGQSDRERLDALRAELDLSPSSLLETLETVLAVEADALASRKTFTAKVAIASCQFQKADLCPPRGSMWWTRRYAKEGQTDRSRRWSSTPSTTSPCARGDGCSCPSPTRSSCTWGTRSTTA